MTEVDQLFLPRVLLDPENSVSFLTVIEPVNFDMQRIQLKFNDFAFMFGSPSRDFRDQVLNFCQTSYNKLKEKINNNFLINLKDRMRTASEMLVIDDSNFDKILSILFNLAYYTAISQNRDAYIRTFSSASGSSRVYYCVVSSKELSNIEALIKIQKKIKRSEKFTGRCSFIAIMSKGLKKF